MVVVCQRLRHLFAGISKYSVVYLILLTLIKLICIGYWDKAGLETRFVCPSKAEPGDYGDFVAGSKHIAINVFTISI